MRTTRRDEPATARPTRGSPGREPSVPHSTMDAGITTGDMTLFGTKKASVLATRTPGGLVPGDSRTRAPWTFRARETGGGKARGQMRKKMGKATVTVLVVALMFALLAGGFWSGTQAVGSG